MARAEPRRRGDSFHGVCRARRRTARWGLAASWARRSPYAATRRRRALSTAARAGAPVARRAGALVYLGVATPRALRARARIPWRRAGSHAGGTHASAVVGARAGVALGRLWHGAGVAAARESARPPAVAARGGAGAGARRAVPQPAIRAPGITGDVAGGARAGERTR